MSNKKKWKVEYPDSYFEGRLFTDLKRIESFKQEFRFISKYINQGKVLDIGCSSGEFLETIDWRGLRYGMEVSDLAIREAMKRNISFDKDIFNSEDYFDLIIYRGTIQHIETPFLYLKESFDSLKKGGLVAFLATPNSRSIYYKIWNTLPFLAPSLNFYIPSDKQLINAMENFGYEHVDIEYPYLNSPYASFFSDHIKFILKLLGFKVTFPFWKSSMNIIFKKP